MKPLFIPALCLAFAIARSAEAQVQIQLDGVQDTRANLYAQVSGLQVQINARGKPIENAKFVQVIVKTALDDTDGDLADHDKLKHAFVKVDASGQVAYIHLTLKSPARKANLIKELSGEAEFFVPKNDSAATIIVKSSQLTAGQPVVSPALTAAGIEITTYSKPQADAIKAKQQAKAKANSMVDLGDKLPDGLGGMFQLAGPNGIAVQIKDPNQKLVQIAFQDATSEAVSGHPPSPWDDPENTSLSPNNFATDFHGDTWLVIYIATPKSIVKVPFSLKLVSLP